jgi:hypothetical protein
MKLNQEQLAHLKTINKKNRQMSFLLECLADNIISESEEFISTKKESKVKVEIVKDEKLKGTGFENLFFKVTIPIGTPIQDSLNAVDEFFKEKPVNFPELTSREKAMCKIIEMRREYDESDNYKPTNPTHFGNDYTNHIEEKNHLCWIYNRLINYGENHLFDYMHKLKEIALNFSAENKYAEEDMKHAFAESRLTHSMFGFKHSTFKDYIDSLKNPS